MKLMSIAGARPNFMKIASIANAVEEYNVEEGNSLKQVESIKHIIVHTGQHYDTKMSQSFFDDLGIPEPDINLEVGSGSHACQTADIMTAFEKVLLKELPDILLVVGDVNSTIACSLVASKIEYPQGGSIKRPIIVHVEAGLRSFDREMPEEINRILTDSLSDLLFITEESAIANLKDEGVASEKVIFSGNVMIDTLQRHLEQAGKSQIKKTLGINHSYGLVTLHRPSNVDTLEMLEPLVDTLITIAGKKSLVFAIHPRTLANLKRFSLFSRLEESEKIIITEPLTYLDFLNLARGADIVVTDSGGIQEETTFLNVPCVTLRENTERPVTVDIGSNYLIGTDAGKIIETVDLILSGHGKKAAIPKYWDGQAGKRIIDSLIQHWKNKTEY
jgi:UDP-N-acetylglucosamine 2-epimerase (non-hydrolysing)